MEARVVALHRYPVKGLSPERIPAADLAAGAYFPDDRLYAVENGPSGFDPEAPVHQPKIKFLMLMRDEALARLETRYDAGVLVVREGGREVVRANLDEAEGRLALEAFLRRYVLQSSPKALRGPPRVLAAPRDRFRFTDSRSGYVSLLNLASVAALEDWVGRPVDPLRFRMNVHLEGLAPWAELDLVGREFATASGLRLKVTKRTQRCAATNVEPGTGLRDMAIPRLLQERLGHADLGVYAEVTAGGGLAEGDVLAAA